MWFTFWTCFFPDFDVIFFLVWSFLGINSDQEFLTKRRLAVSLSYLTFKLLFFSARTVPIQERERLALYRSDSTQRDILLFLFCLHVLELRTFLCCSLAELQLPCLRFYQWPWALLLIVCLSKIQKHIQRALIIFYFFFFLFSIVKSNMKKIMFISFFSCVLF